MASIGYAKPHYRLITKTIRDAYWHERKWDEGNWIPSINSTEIYPVIKAMKEILNINVIYFNNQYWVVSYPQGQVHA